MVRNQQLLESVLECDELEEAVHLLNECIIRMELTLGANHINDIDQKYCELTIAKVKQFLGEEDENS